MFPKLYNKNETNFIHNGLGLLTGAISVTVEEELNSLMELKMEYDNEGFLSDIIQEEMIIKTKANDKQDEQLFRIYSITKNHKNDNLVIGAQHITYDLGNNFVEKLEARNLTKRQVMQLIGSSTNYPHPFNVTSSNTTTQSSTSLYRTNPLQMIAGMEGSILQIWGGQIERDNFNLIMHDRRGSDDGVLVTYKKNLTGLTAKFDISNLVTRIYPFVYKEATDDEPERLIEVPGKYIDSPHIDDYEMPYILPVDFSSEEDIETSQDLLNESKDWFKETGRDKASAEMEVQFEHLWETEEYKDVAALELVGMGDTITVKHSKLGVEGTAVVNRIEYDSIARKNRAVHLGNVKANFTDKVNEVGSVIDRVDDVERNANQAIRSANGKNTIHYGPDEPTTANVDDLWFRVVDGEYTRTYRFDGIQWQLIISKDVADIEETANTAHNRANDAVEKSELATSNANEAISEAQGAFDKAQESLTTAGTAKSISDEAFSDAQQALSTADISKLASESAERLAGDAIELSNTAKSDASTAITNAQSALTGIDDLQTSVSVEINDINGELSRKVSQSVFDGLEGTVGSHSTSISQNAEAITRKADSEYVDTINKTVENNSFSITETAKGLDLKADSSVVNTLTGQVEAHSTELQVHANELSNKMTTVDADNKYATQSELTQTSESLSSDIVAVRSDLDGLEIGGTNLQRHTELSGAISNRIPNGWSFNSHNSNPEIAEIIPSPWGTEGLQAYHIKTSNSRAYIATGQRIPVEAGERITVSVKADSNDLEVWWQFFDENENWVTRNTGQHFTETENRQYFTLEVPEGATQFHLNRVGIGVSTTKSGDSEVRFEGIKVEKGTKATDWSRAEEDIQHEFSSINQTVSDITTRVGDSEDNLTTLQQTAESLAGRLSDAEGNLTTLTATSQGLQNRMTNAEGDISTVTNTASANQSRLSDAEGNISTLTQTASSLDNTIKSVRDDLDGLEIGTTNLAKGTSDEFKSISMTSWNAYHDGSVNPDTEVIPGEEYTASVYYRNVTGVDMTIRIFWTLSDGSRSESSNGSYVRIGEEGYAAITRIAPSNAVGAKHVIRRNGNSNQGTSTTDYREVMLVRGNKVANWSPAPEDLATQSQITQLSDNINARVQKGDVINQINISTEDILISGKKLILDGDTTVNGTFRVNNANITSVDAGKVTVGTLEGHTLSGGQVIGGYIEQQSGSRRLEMTNGEISSFHNSELAMKFGGYSLEFYNRANDPIGRIIPIAEVGSRTPGMGIIVDGDILNIGYERGNLYRPVLRTDFLDNVTTVSGPYNNANAGSRLRLFANRRQVSEDKFSSHDQPAIILDQSDSTNDAIVYYGGFNRRSNASTYFRHRSSSSTYSTTMRVANNYVRVYDELRVGSANNPSGILPFSNSIQWRYNTNNYIRQQDDGRISFYMSNNRRQTFGPGGGAEFGGNVVVDGDIRNAGHRTTSNSVNTHIFSNTGRIARSTSARKYKTDIQLAESVDYEKILDLNIKSWLDKEEVYGNVEEKIIPTRHYGLIADELEEIGLSEFVVYDNEEVENYSDRAWTLLIPNVRDLRAEVQDLDTKVDDELTALRKQNESLIIKIAHLEQRINYMEVS